MAVLLIGLGMAAVFTALLDVVWTAAAAGSGAGPASGRRSARLWRWPWPSVAARAAPRHRFLTVGGIVLVVVIVVVWAALAWVGWWLIYSATDGAVIDSASGEPAGLMDDGAYRAALEDQAPRRCQLAQLLVDDGWHPDAWGRRMQAIRTRVGRDSLARP